MDLDQQTCERALLARDVRFDGWFFTGVHSTKIYCRPSCPARTPSLQGVTFYPSAATAQSSGYRACKRCRPDSVPGSPEWSPRSDVVARAVRLIHDGVVEREGVSGLARQLHYSSRHLHRLLRNELGVGPLELARAERSRVARVLLETTDLPMGDVAFGSGFGSLRQFNDTIREVFAVTPSDLRERRRPLISQDGSISLRLAYRPPLNVASLFGHLIATGVPGVERWDGATFHRVVVLHHGRAIIGLTPDDGFIRLDAQMDDLRDLMSLVTRCRQLLDLDADPTQIGQDLARDELLRPLLEAAPGRRLPGSINGEEMVLRAVLGQQVSTKSAATMAGKLAAALGAPTGRTDLSATFPTAEAIAAAPDALLAMPATRRNTLRAVATLLASRQLDVSPGADRSEVRRVLQQVRGIGPWTIGVVAMRGLADPDEPLLSDLGVVNAAKTLGL
ncbi:MAG: AlkA N-terminal domain-containing protein, partial [Actinomycetota bacterium]